MASTPAPKKPAATATPAAADKADAKTLALFQRQWSKALSKHTERVRRYERRDDVYNAVLQRKDDNWRSDLHPPYALETIELMEANIGEDDPEGVVKPRGPQYQDAAKKFTKLINYQRDQDHRAEKYPQFRRQALIRGLTVAKIVWSYERQSVQRRVFNAAPGDGGVPQEAAPETVEVTVKDQPSFVVVDVKDFLWDPAATSLDDAAFVFHRTYSTIDELKAQGVYRNLPERRTSGAAPSSSDATNKRDLSDRCIVVERWTRDRLVTVLDHTTVIRDEANPYWHGKKPFVAASTLPKLFSVEGKSEVELIADLQAALWDISNQRIDNVRLINNAILMVQEGSQDVDAMEFAPGAIWKVQSPGEVVPWSPNPAILAPAVEAEQIIKQDIQNVTGAVAAISGAAPDTVDQKTATGISIVQNSAQKRMLRKKEQINFALARAGEMEIALNQQLLPRAVAIPLTGSDGEWLSCRPDEIQGDFCFSAGDVSESLNRQERRGEALTKAQFYIALDQAMVASGSPSRIDLAMLARDVAEAFDEDPDKYLTAAPPPPMAPPGLPPGLPGMGGPPGLPPGMPPGPSLGGLPPGLGAPPGPSPMLLPHRPVAA